jgi:lipid-binding SYLF domain-containing protein
MKKFCTAILLFFMVSVSAAWAKNYQISGRIKGAQTAVKRMIKSHSAYGLAQSVKEGIGIVIFPDVVKAGFIVSGRYGEGLIMRHDKTTGKWYGPAFYSISGGSVGLQAGATSTALVLTVNNEKGMKAFRGGAFTLGVDVTAAAGPGGKESYVGTSFNSGAALYSYSISRGVYAGAALDGSVLSELPRVNDQCWKVHLNNVQILSRECPRYDVQELIRLLNQLIAMAK